MKPATLEQIGQLGGPEKQAAREYAPTVAPMFAETAVRMAFLQGIAWERARTAHEALQAQGGREACGCPAPGMCAKCGEPQ